MIQEVTINQRVSILIDGNNIEKGLQSQYNKRLALDFVKFIPNIVRNRQLTNVFYFREGKKISEKLSKRLSKNYNGSTVVCHKSADVPLTIKAVQLAEKVDCVIIGSGDADYVSLVEFLKMKGVRVEIAAVYSTISAELKRVADFCYYVGSDDAWEIGGDSEKDTIEKEVEEEEEVTGVSADLEERWS
jgi:uncharacterized LabA/DUF88 family protein